MDYWAPDSEIVPGAWASGGDLALLVADLDTLIGGDHQRVEQAIRSATAEVQAVLRQRYPERWPWQGAPPRDVRDAVAAIAVHRACAGRLAATVASDLLEHLHREADAARDYIREVAQKRAHPALEPVTNRQQAWVSPPPSGEFGFAARGASRWRR